MNVTDPVNGDAFRGMCDHRFWHDASPHENHRFSQGDTVFCKIDEVWRLFRALRRTRKRIVLVTGEGDKPVSKTLWAHKPPHVFHWFGTNNFVEDARSTPLPLGLGGEGSHVTPSWDEICRACATPAERSRLLYANFGTASNPIVREPILRWVHNQRWITSEAHAAESGKTQYLRQLCTHHFVLCPPGNGEDTHRMWEALCCGAIPVVRHSPAMREFMDLPILFVHDLMAISEKSLQVELDGWTQRPYRTDMLDVSTWKARVEKSKELCAKAGAVSLHEWLRGWLCEILAVAKR